MSKKVILVCLLTCLIAHALAFAQDNPFTAEKPKKGMRYPVFIQKIIRQISTLQRQLTKEITKLAKEIKEQRSLKPIILILMLTFIFGMVHALGPGHGKTITFSYFIAERASIRKGILVGSLIGFLHALSALALVLVLYFIVRQVFISQVEDFGRIIKLISYSFITAIGIFLLIKAIVGIVKKKESQSEEQRITNVRSIIPFAIAVGLTPCTGAVIILLFSISMGILSLGIISTFCMALGMATTISIVGIIAILAKNSLTRIFKASTKISMILQFVLSITGAVLIALLGLLLFTSTL